MKVVLVDDASGHGDQYCQELEAGNILVVEKTPFLPSESDLAFLREQRQAATSAHKNIAYKPNRDKVTGTASSAEMERTRGILAAYSKGALDFMTAILPRYAKVWKVDYASFRPFEEQNRKISLNRRNDLMHVDAFPTRPTHGGRILRLFTNIHPSKDRVWATSDSFEELARLYAVDAGIERVTGTGANIKRSLAKAASAVGIKTPVRSPYDQFMVDFHKYLKLNEHFQKNGRAHQVAFKPGATWISFTDQIAHAAESGQYAVEQTCIVPLEGMVKPEWSPVGVLSKLSKKPLVEVKILKGAGMRVRAG